ncbi:MAG: methyltransferase domain-containing protein [Candidatus Andersenbacteria bacterium]
MNNKTSKEAEILYDKVGFGHEDLREVGELDSEVLSQLFEKLPQDLDGKVILDAGGGAGLFSQMVLERGAEKVVLIDISSKMLNFAKKRKEEHQLDKLEINKGDLLDTKFDSDSFDIILCIYALPHVSDIQDAFKEFSRVLKEGGLVFLASDFYTIDDMSLHGVKTNYKIGDVRLFGFAHTKDDYLQAINENGLETQELFVVDDAKGLSIDPSYEHKNKMQIHTFGAVLYKQ